MHVFYNIIRYDQYGNARRKGHNDLRLVILSLLFWSSEGNFCFDFVTKLFINYYNFHYIMLFPLYYNIIRLCVYTFALLTRDANTKPICVIAFYCRVECFVNMRRVQQKIEEKERVQKPKRTSYRLWHEYNNNNNIRPALIL